MRLYIILCILRMTYGKKSKWVRDKMRWNFPAGFPEVGILSKIDSNLAI